MITGVFIMHYELRLALEPATTGTTAEATTEASATRTATAESATTTTGTTRTSRAARTTKATATVLKASEEVQTIDDVNHTIAGDGVILGLAVGKCSKRAADR